MGWNPSADILGLPAAGALEVTCACLHWMETTPTSYKQHGCVGMSLQKDRSSERRPALHARSSNVPR